MVKNKNTETKLELDGTKGLPKAHKKEEIILLIAILDIYSI